MLRAMKTMVIFNRGRGILTIWDFYYIYIIRGLGNKEGVT